MSRGPCPPVAPLSSSKPLPAAWPGPVALRALLGRSVRRREVKQAFAEERLKGLAQKPSPGPRSSFAPAPQGTQRALAGLPGKRRGRPRLAASALFLPFLSPDGQGQQQVFRPVLGALRPLHGRLPPVPGASTDPGVGGGSNLDGQRKQHRICLHKWRVVQSPCRQRGQADEPNPCAALPRPLPPSPYPVCRESGLGSIPAPGVSSSGTTSQIPLAGPCGPGSPEPIEDTFPPVPPAWLSASRSLRASGVLR